VLRRLLFGTFSRIYSWVFGTRVARMIWKVPGSRSLHHLLMTRFTPSTVVVDGHTLHLDPTDSLLLSVHGSYEDYELSLFTGSIRAGDTVVDIGAHIGLYTLAAARAVGPTGRVVAYEPSSGNFSLLEKNIEANGYTNVTTSRSAVSDRAGEALLALNAENTGDNSLVRTARADRETSLVTTVTLDEELPTTEGVVVLKMDIQGGEPAALAGGRRALAAAGDVILFTEVSPGHLDGAAGAEDFCRRLVDAEFDLLLVDEEHHSLSPFHIDGMAEASREAGHDGHVNLVCTKGAEAAARLRALV
jgi:FkbM family methyltransferase